MTQSNASKVLEAALEEMDGILLGRDTNKLEQNKLPASTVLSTANSLAIALQQAGNSTPVPDRKVAEIIKSWLDVHFPESNVDERIQRLQRDKEALTHQIQSLADQVASQSEKLVELESNLTIKTQLLNNTEDMLQREMLERSSLETQKLELISEISELKLRLIAFEKDNIELRASQLNNNNNNTSNNNGSFMSSSRRSPISSPRQRSTNSSNVLSSPTRHGSLGNLKQFEDNNSIPPKNQTLRSALHHQLSSNFNSLPRSIYTSVNENYSLSSNNTGIVGTNFTSASNKMADKSLSGVLEQDKNANLKQRNVAFAEFERIIDNPMEPNRSSTPQPTKSSSISQKGITLKNLFGKLRRSNSGNFEDESIETEFKRGGLRATTGSKPWRSEIFMKPFEEWNIDEICAWLSDLGLSPHEELVRKKLANGYDNTGEEFLKELERDLNFRNPLQKKKFQLAIDELCGRDKSDLFLKAAKLDNIWVLRWLDDIGLPQHKDMFLSFRVDGRMLHKLTYEDLSHLHMTSCLHVASLRRGIQIMREYKWNPDCLIRRSNSEVPENEPIALWTTHRVMEWLRIIDLAEYAPNLRGAGIHGALMVYEPRFNAELLADLLSIPPNKTLLRRHLCTHFKELLGRDIIQSKRSIENTLGYQPLTITAKIKTPKKSQFSLKRRKSFKGDEWKDLVCPLENSGDGVEHIVPTKSSVSSCFK